MRKYRMYFMVIMVLFIWQAVPNASYGAEPTVTAKLPTFPVQINGTVVDSSKAEFPLLVYKNITYMPMTYDFCNLIGLESVWTEGAGLQVSIRKSQEIATVEEGKNDRKNPQRVTAQVIQTPVTINGKPIDNNKEIYPLLRYKDVTYFPLTFRFTMEEFNIYNNFNERVGLMVYSENRFFYKYSTNDGQKQCVDFRVSSILFEAVAITIADGSNSYPVNNVTMYDAWQSGIPQYPQYVGEKHYGYLLDESGKVKVNTESKLTPFAFYTTAIADLKNPVVENVELE